MFRPWRRGILAAFALTAVAAGVLTPMQMAEASTGDKITNHVSTIAGENRFDTAIALSKTTKHFTGGTVFIANGYSYADALAAGPAAAKEDAPILLTPQGSLWPAAATELQRLKPSKIVIIGSESAVSGTVFNQVQAAVSSAKVTRVGGDNRHDTARLIARTWFPTAKRAYIASGWNFPDAISAAAAGARTGTPVLLTHESGLANETISALRAANPTGVTLIGSAAALPQHISDKAKLAAPNAAMGRIGGADRYETNALLMARVFPTPKKTNVVITTGQNYPDALIASTYADLGTPVLLSPVNCMVPKSRELLEDYVVGSMSFILRVGNSVEKGAWGTQCGTRTPYEQGTAPKPTTTTAPKPTTTTAPKPTATPTPTPTNPTWGNIPVTTTPTPTATPKPTVSTVTRPAGLDPRDDTPEQMYSFITKFNEIRKQQGLPIVSANRIYMSTTVQSNKTVNQAQMKADGILFDAHAGHAYDNEVYYYVGGSSKTGAHAAAQGWWNSYDHRDILYTGGYDADINNCVVFNSAVVTTPTVKYTTHDQVMNAAWTSCANAKADGVVSTSLDSRIK
ncbi:cell wall-binding repeat-containing protein [Pseudoclavibacter alba]|uniref:Cell wall-binding repeat-containing protein n=1 Tax=Pseudoclavibacter albus TaxID=272241 RepID=A0ABT2HZF2_9MICO|nr:cell wall-binding repeat-containing protein [Pseudoclavibacter alba]MCT2043674.1 cell wall-binding repeat-containing protein [Pseudoclavibacter alba]